MFLQLNQAGAITQMGTVYYLEVGYIDPGTAAAFVLGPAGIARAYLLSQKLLIY